MGRVFRITSQAEWDLTRLGVYLRASALDQRDGFMHCSAADQVVGTLAAHFAGRSDVLLLTLACDALPPAALRWEASRAGALFPHLYGDVPVSAVVRVQPLELVAGVHRVPALDDGGDPPLAQDTAHMRRAIALAREGVGSTGLNPSVGCVIARGGAVLAEAVTAAGGRPHAEEQALRGLADADLADVTVYVTLEPCGARSSGVASCSTLLAERRPGRVVIACEDPSTYAAGTGLVRLQKAGVRVELGLCADEARELLYASYIARLSGR